MLRVHLKTYHVTIQVTAVEYPQTEVTNEISYYLIQPRQAISHGGWGGRVVVVLLEVDCS